MRSHTRAFGRPRTLSFLERQGARTQAALGDEEKARRAAARIIALWNVSSFEACARRFNAPVVR